jgi:hypothetical protein
MIEIFTRGWPPCFLVILGVVQHNANPLQSILPRAPGNYTAQCCAAFIKA